MPETIAIIGASARAAAASAVRAGLQPVTADLFADLDLRRIATATRISPYPDGFLDWLRAIEPPAWMYTGALENHPELVDQMAWIAPLWGNPGDVLHEVRNPWNLAASLRDAGLLFPETRAAPDGLPRDGSWLVKTYRGASGSGVQPLTTAEPDLGGPVWYQQRALGVPGAAVYVANGEECIFLGLTKQLVGEHWLHAKEFQYAGSIGLYPVSTTAMSTIRRVGEVLTQQFALVGLFGVDFVIDRDRVWTIEVNPRYTASSEIVERATNFSAIAAHAAANKGVNIGLPLRNLAQEIHGKAVAFAKRSVAISQNFAAWALSESLTEPWPKVADVSPAHSSIAAGRPVITVFAAGGSVEDVEQQLRERVAEVESRLYAD